MSSGRRSSFSAPVLLVLLGSSSSTWKTHRFAQRRRFCTAACATALLAIMANTYSPVVHRSWLVHPPVPACSSHQSNPDLDPYSPTYGEPICVPSPERASK